MRKYSSLQDRRSPVGQDLKTDQVDPYKNTVLAPSSMKQDLLESLSRAATNVWESNTINKICTKTQA